MQSFVQFLLGVEEITPEQRLQRIKELNRYLDSGSSFLETTLKCPTGQEKVSVKTLMKENKEFFIQALDKEKDVLDGEAAKELGKIIAMIKKIG